LRANEKKREQVKKTTSQTTLVFIGMILGLAAGWLLPDLSVHLEPLSNIFIRLIKTIIVPIIFATLVSRRVFLRRLLWMFWR